MTVERNRWSSTVRHDRRVTDEVGDLLGDAQAGPAQRLELHDLLGGRADDVDGVIHENTASRYKSRLSARVNALK